MANDHDRPDASEWGGERQLRLSCRELTNKKNEEEQGPLIWLLRSMHATRGDSCALHPPLAHDLPGRILVSVDRVIRHVDDELLVLTLIDRGI